MSTLFRRLPILTIAFASGISGAWWSGQFTQPLPSWWGWFGAALIGVALWSGVEIAVRGQTPGWAIALIAGGGDIIMARQYFAHHPPALAWPLALVPTLLTLLTAYQASLHEANARAAAAEQRQQIEAEQRKARAAEQRHRQRLERIKLEAELAARGPNPADTVPAMSPAMSTANGHHPHPSPAMTAADRRAWLAAHPGPHNVPDLAARWRVSPRTVRRDLHAAGYLPASNGQWQMEQTP